jgi:uncharacterized protein
MIKGFSGGVDCDVHVAIPDLKTLLSHMDGHWPDAMVERGFALPNMASYPPNAPITARNDWRDENGRPPSTLDALARDLLDRFDVGTAIVNPVPFHATGFSEDMAAAVTRGINRWVAAALLDKDERLCAGISVPPQNPTLAAAEIDRVAPDERFVQVLLPGTADAPFGRRHYWPIYEAACRHDLPVGIMAAHSFRFPTTAIGWTSYFYEDYAAHAQAFHGQLASLITEGVFQKFPTLRVVLIESGVTWLPAFLWRMDKVWRGLRTEVPWVDQAPSAIVRQRVRLTAQPFDAPAPFDEQDGKEAVSRLLSHFPSNDLLLGASDYPRWQFDGDAIWPKHFPDALIHRMTHDNPHETYPRLNRPELHRRA